MLNSEFSGFWLTSHFRPSVLGLLVILISYKMLCFLSLFVIYMLWLGGGRWKVSKN